jgi:hypothetical protein
MTSNNPLKPVKRFIMKPKTILCCPNCKKPLKTFISWGGLLAICKNEDCDYRYRQDMNMKHNL